MDVFRLRNHVISEYSDYVTSFINIQDPEVRQYVDAKLAQGVLWPEPLLQLNPSFAPGPLVDELVETDQLHPGCGGAFRIRSAGGSSRPLRLHQHQADAIAAAQSGESYVLTTGTGSGKSLAYILPIVDRVLRTGSGRGIQAIIVYPMNALANSQEIELRKFLWPEHPEGRPPVTFRCYTGQESHEERDEIKLNPPDILLTNYVMLELLLTRPDDRAIVAAAQGLSFLVLDELHTYRGRQGADVAMLVRRVREACQSPRLQYIGTSATLAGGASFAAQQQQIAAVASRIFGTDVSPGRVIGETLSRLTEELDFTDPEVRAALTACVRQGGGGEADFEAFRSDPLASWIESTFGLSTEQASGRLRRADPRRVAGVGGAAEALSDLTGLGDGDCEQAIAATLMAGYRVRNPTTDLPVFAFRLHQFISRGDTVYSSLEDPGVRYVTHSGQQFVPGDRSRVLLPLAFCRECGQEYYVVTRREEEGQWTYLPRDLRDLLRGERDDADPEEEAGFLFANSVNPWPSDPEEVMERLPEDWVQRTGEGRTVKRDRRKWRPEAVELGPDGRPAAGGQAYHFLRAPFPFCMNCGVTYASRITSDFGKLAALSSEQRSSATTVLGLSVLQSIRKEETLAPEARKLLSFTDNRQDASLQAGHFNDFVEVGLLRGAIYRAAREAGEEGIPYEDLTARVFRALDLPLESYASDPSVRFSARTDTDRALREVLGYRIYHDLRRGWRVSAPNLEQCGLLRLRYASLDELCAEDGEWAQLHPALSGATPQQRAEVCQVLLDFLRRQLALRVNYLEPVYQESLRQLSSQRLVEPWAIDENERLVGAKVAYPRSQRKTDSREDRDDPTGLYVSARSGFGLYLRRPGTFPGYGRPIDTAGSEEIIRQLFRVLAVGIIEQVSGASHDDEAAGYQLPASALVWLAGDGRTPARDPISVPRAPREGSRTNRFFQAFYRDWALQLKGLQGREHTAQVRYEDRVDRENRFREATLPVLFCSPTMELGVDIAQLNVVNMRNVPPTPANYAQRSGRAGRSGQPALVYTYCTTKSPHDQYFFRRPADMVSGAVATPRLDLANEELVRAHVDAVWLAEADLGLGSSLQEVLDLEGTPPSLELRPSVREKLASPVARERAAARLRSIFVSVEDELRVADWYTPEWLASTLQTVETRFEEACERWRGLYRSALQQFEAQNRVIGDATRPASEKEQAKRLRAEAEAQLELLTDKGSATRSDFYSYRYFASEGFLPGYSFPRLPLSAYLPARRKAKGTRDEFLSRPRFLAISEFGPRAIIYHEGSHYVINKAIFPVGEDVVTGKAKLCPRCGYLHRLNENGIGADVCDHCGAPLEVALQSLFRLRNVSTKRRDRITSDEEERVRMGYDLMTAVRFVAHGDRPACRTAEVVTAAGEPLLRLCYGQSADIWRINLGWRRRADQNRHGFVLDLERGYWEKDETNPEDLDDPMSARKARVIPYVEDWRNCLLIEPPAELPIEVMASLQAALKTAIQVLYQLEDDELAAEPMPKPDERRLILLYEAAEGGAGVLRQLVDDPEALQQVAKEALRLCHFDPATGDDLDHAEGRDERCEAACYDCLMSYYNQLDHRLVDRQCVKELLLALAGSTVRVSPGDASRGEHLEDLRGRCDTGLEREWLDLVSGHGLRLPDAAQHRVESCSTVPDFWYAEHRVAVYVDGPVHDQPDVQAEDGRITDALHDHGYLVLRFHHASKQEWLAACRRHPEVFGIARGESV